jgi:hypothetical protein
MLSARHIIVSFKAMEFASTAQPDPRADDSYGRNDPMGVIRRDSHDTA